MLAVTAFAMTIVMTMGDYDLSVGSMASLAGIVLAVVFGQSDSAAIAMVAALLAGLAGGAFNGFLVSYLGILPFVATLGTLTIFSGLAFLLAGGKTSSAAVSLQAWENSHGAAFRSGHGAKQPSSSPISHLSRP